MAPIAAPIPVPIKAPWPAPVPVPAPMAAPDPAPTAAPVTVLQDAVIKVNINKPETAIALEVFMMCILLWWQRVKPTGERAAMRRNAPCAHLFFVEAGSEMSNRAAAEYIAGMQSIFGLMSEIAAFAKPRKRPR
ncbi:MAG: hypothetical protein PHX38_02805 [Sulfuricella sp.]|nr:hypothetical protein [Sulfuricella sp.]